MKAALAASGAVATLSGAYLLATDSWGNKDMVSKLDSILGGHYAESKDFKHAET